MTINKRFPVFDGDSHVVEPPELWELSTWNPSIAL